MNERTTVESGCGQIIFNLHGRGSPSSEALTLRNGARTLLGSPSGAFSASQSSTLTVSTERPLPFYQA